MSVRETLWVDREKEFMDGSLSTHMEESELHYIAGLIDGEGSIYIPVNKRDSGLGYRIRPKFSLEMKWDEHTQQAFILLERYIDELDGVSVDSKQKNYSSDKRHQGRKFDVSGYDNVIGFLEPLLDYLRVKRKPAELVVNAPWRIGTTRPTDEQRKNRFMELIEIRKEIREIGANRETKYPYEKLVEEIE